MQPGTRRKRIAAVISWSSLFLFLTLIAIWISEYAFGFGYLSQIQVYASPQSAAYPHRRIIVQLGWAHGMTITNYGEDGRAIPGPDYPANARATPERTAWEAQYGPKVSNFLRIRYVRMGNGRIDSQNRAWHTGWIDGLTIPHWVFAVVLLSMPGYRAWIRLIDWNHRRRLKSGSCRKCGYDLRASSERCPECGTPIPPDESSNCSAHPIA